MEPRRGPTDWDIWVVSLAKFFAKLHPLVIFGTLLVICLAVYALSWGLARH